MNYPLDDPMDQPRKPRTIGDLLEDAPFNRLLLPLEARRRNTAFLIAREFGSRAATAWLDAQKRTDEEGDR